MTKEDFLIQLGATISRHRKRMKLTQTEIDLRFDMEHGSMTRIEKGRVNITAETLLKISEAMAVGGMVGCGIFSVLGVIISITGQWAWLSFVLAGLIALIAAVTYLHKNFHTLKKLLL